PIVQRLSLADRFERARTPRTEPTASAPTPTPPTIQPAVRAPVRCSPSRGGVGGNGQNDRDPGHDALEPSRRLGDERPSVIVRREGFEQLAVTFPRAGELADVLLACCQV